MNKIAASVYKLMNTNITIGIAICMLISAAVTVYAATEAGTVIKNQASASYRDTLGIKRVATSNVVETLIRQVAALELTRDQQKPGTAGQELYYSHTLVNTGNGPDRFRLNAANVGTDDFDLDSLRIYPDNNRDGLPDTFTPISFSRRLGPGESQSIVAAGIVPAGTPSASIGRTQITAASDFDNSKTAVNINTTLVTDSAVVELNKSISGLQGSSPDGPFTVSINYRNTSDVEAVDVVLIDALPAGMSYVAGTGVWSVSSGVVLTDSNASDDQGGIRYCAYDTSCTGVPEAISDTDTLTTNQVTAIIDSVAPSQSGSLQFDVMIDSDLPASVLYNTAEVEYFASGVLFDRIVSNAVPFRVLLDAGVVINGSTVSRVDGTGEPASISTTTDGNSVLFSNTIWNLGNSVDSFDVTLGTSSFPDGTLFRVLQADGQTPLLDTSGNGIADTGPVQPGSSYQIQLQAILPAGATGNNAGAAFEVTTIATSVSDSTISNPMRNQLNNITAGAVDITNVAALGDPLAAGIGPGPEAAAVTVLSINPGDTGVLELFVNNTSDFPAEFDLSASIHADFSSVELPEGWRVQFTFPDETIVSTTGVIAPGDHVVVLANITVAADALPATANLYFRVLNEQYSLTDIKHDAIVVNGQQSLLLDIDQQGQTQAGSSHTYNHTISNSGNTDVTDISVAVTDSLASQGWSSLVYEDTDGDGTHSAADVPVDLLSLAAGESKALFVKVFAPATASQPNSTVLTASWSSGARSVTDITNISTGEITVVKEQALDNGCDGVLDSAYSLGVFSVEPGNNCVSYRLTAANRGSAAILNVVVADATPTFTSYSGTASCSKSNCTIVEPLPGDEGEVKASLPTLQAGDSVVVEFVVRVD